MISSYDPPRGPVGKFVGEWLVMSIWTVFYIGLAWHLLDEFGVL